jgi:hypothetical protein
VVLELDDPKSSRTWPGGSKQTLRGVVVTRIAKHVRLPPGPRRALDTMELLEAAMTYRKIDITSVPGGKSWDDN